MANEGERINGRFERAALKVRYYLDETAVLSCMAYVDLNPIRAGMAEDLFDSNFTAIQQGLFDYIKHKPLKNTDEQSLVSRVKKQRAILLRALHSYQACRWYRAHRNYWGKYYRS